MIELNQFLCSQKSIDHSSIIICGIPYDCTSSFRPGSRFAMPEIRRVSEFAIEEFSFYQNNSLEDVSFYDAGDFPLMVGNPQNMVDIVRQEYEKYLKNQKKIIAIGGEHLITYPIFLALKKHHQPFTIIHLDAHADLRPGYLADKLSHASVFRLCLDEGLSKLIQIGIRSGTKEEYLERKDNSRIVACNHITELGQYLKKGENIYISLDLDYFDPSFLPGTGTPESGGANLHDFIQLLKILKESRIHLIGADMVELAPQIDPTGNSTVFAAKILRELILLMNHFCS
ncbi:MAG: agmatinase [Spirochaetes bacterium]|nr:agmatinase [Spirochaetota bacterium]